MPDRIGRRGIVVAEKAKFLATPYNAYYHRDIPKEDEELTHVGPGTPGGEYLRRFWQPIAHSAELQDLPRWIRILGEDLVLFRDRSGRIGLLELHCSHRGTSLEFGLISERGIRCCYHGWLYDVDGRILETPGEPPDSTLKQRLCHGAYPTFEYKGLVFAYMGPPDKKPAFPIYDAYELPGHNHVPSKIQLWDCNWVQIQDNSMDPSHLVFLHTQASGAQFAESFGVMPMLEWQETPIGMIYITPRRVGDNVWVRIVDFILPNIDQTPEFLSEDGTKEKIFSRPIYTWWRVPIDDTHTMVFGLLHIPQDMQMDVKEIDEAIWLTQTENRTYEERQRTPGDWTVIVGQGPITIHAREHLACTDRGVIMFRKLLRQGIRAVKKGKDPKGLARVSGQVIPTYAQNTVLRIPRRSTPEAERQLLLEIGRKAATGYYVSNPRANA